MTPLARLKSGWMRIAQRLGEVQTVVILTLVYTMVIAPMALLLRLVGCADLLEMRQARGDGFALPKQQVPTDRERCERQF
ncbi:MAG: hypothetical protein E4H11_09210 [Myxococcales bacterium]|nr:MAG: hypothetical protein E4H11_09210 [Myxococcales bacterium]